MRTVFGGFLFLCFVFLCFDFQKACIKHLPALCHLHVVTVFAAQLVHFLVSPALSSLQFFYYLALWCSFPYYVDWGSCHLCFLFLVYLFIFLISEHEKGRFWTDQSSKNPSYFVKEEDCNPFNTIFFLVLSFCHAHIFGPGLQSWRGAYTPPHLLSHGWLHSLPRFPFRCLSGGPL